MTAICKFSGLLITGLLCCLFLVTAGIADEKSAEFKAIVNKIIDGDSLQVHYRGKNITIRLYGIDAPEWKQPYSQSAKRYVKKILLNEEVTIESFYKDAYSRNVAIVSVQGKVVNQLLVEEGLAWVHIYYCHKKICEKWKNLEHLARSKNLGLWQDKNPVPPWVWKSKRR